MFPNASNANQNKSFRANKVLFFNAGMFLISSFISMMLGIGKFFPLGNSDGPNTYPEPMFIPAVCVYKLIIKFGNMAHFFCCNDEFAYSMARVFDGPHINAPLDFIVVKNSDRFIFCPLLFFTPTNYRLQFGLPFVPIGQMLRFRPHHQMQYDWGYILVWRDLAAILCRCRIVPL